MAVIVNIARGHDASYPFKTTGATEGPVITGQCGAGYYLSAMEKGGEPAGTRRFGLEWAHWPGSRSRVIAGFPEKAITQFSSRRTQITKTTLALAEAYEKERRHAPDQWALASIRQFANAMMRRAKEPSAPDFTALLCEWKRASRVAEFEALRDPARTIWHTAPRTSASTGARDDTRAELAQTAARLAPREELTHAQERAATAAGLAQAQESRAGRCAARRRLRATADAATHVRGWRPDERSG